MSIAIGLDQVLFLEQAHNINFVVLVDLLCVTISRVEPKFPHTFNY